MRIPVSPWNLRRQVRQKIEQADGIDAALELGKGIVRCEADASGFAELLDDDVISIKAVDLVADWTSRASVAMFIASKQTIMEGGKR